MSSLIWYIYEFARKTWIDGFFDAKSKEDIAHKPDRFRDFPEVPGIRINSEIIIVQVNDWKIFR